VNRIARQRFRVRKSPSGTLRTATVLRRRFRSPNGLPATKRELNSGSWLRRSFRPSSREPATREASSSYPEFGPGPDDEPGVESRPEDPPARPGIDRRSHSHHCATTPARSWTARARWTDSGLCAATCFLLGGAKSAQYLKAALDGLSVVLPDAPESHPARRRAHGRREHRHAGPRSSRATHVLR